MDRWRRLQWSAPGWSVRSKVACEYCNNYRMPMWSQVISKNPPHSPIVEKTAWLMRARLFVLGCQFVRRLPDTEFKPQYTEKTVRHGVAYSMIWGCFSYYGVGPICHLQWIMNQLECTKIPEEVMLPSLKRKFSWGMGVSTRQRLQTHQWASNILVPDQQDWSGQNNPCTLIHHKKMIFPRQNQEIVRGIVECSPIILGWSTCSQVT